MRVLVIGATGTIGGPVADVLEEAGHQVVRAGSSSGEFRVDLASASSISELYGAALARGPLDSVVCTAGVSQFGSIEKLDDEAFALGIENKLMGQVNLVRLGLDRVTEKGSFTLTSGTLSTRPTPGTSAVAMVGAAVEGFARAAALDLEDRYRINVVSPGWVAESRQKMGLKPMPGIWAADLAQYYLRFVEGEETGVVVEVEG